MRSHFGNARIFGVLYTEDNACLERIALFKQFFDGLGIRRLWRGSIFVDLTRGLFVECFRERANVWRLECHPPRARVHPGARKW